MDNFGSGSPLDTDNLRYLRSDPRMWDIVDSSWTSSLGDTLRKTPTTFNVLELLGYISRFSAFPSPPVLRHIHPILKRRRRWMGPQP